MLVPEEVESVLLGSAMLGASVSSFYPDLKSAMLGMAGPAKVIEANNLVEGYVLLTVCYRTNIGVFGITNRFPYTL